MAANGSKAKQNKMPDHERLASYFILRWDFAFALGLECHRDGRLEKKPACQGGAFAAPCCGMDLVINVCQCCSKWIDKAM